MTPPSPLRRYAPPLALIAVAVVFTAMAFGLDGKSGEIPRLVGIVTLVLLALDLLTRTETPLGTSLLRVLNPDCAEGRGVEAADATVAAEIVAILWVCGFVALVMLIGFVRAIPIYMAAYLLIQGRLGLVKSAAITAAFSLGVWALFVLAFSYRLYGGILFG